MFDLDIAGIAGAVHSALNEGGAGASACAHTKPPTVIPTTTTLRRPVAEPAADDWLTGEVDEAVAKAFPRTAKGKRDALVEDIVKRVLSMTTFEVDVIGARAPIDTIEAYNLIIQVDANGRAAHVTFPDGGEVVG